MTKICTVEGCEKKHCAKGFCQMHWKRNKLYGDPNVKLKWGNKRPSRYKMVQAKGHPNSNAKGAIHEHRLVMSNYLGRPLLPGENVHHINGNPKDNRIENLEIWSTTQPCGQRIEDKIAYAVDILKQYAPELLKEPKCQTHQRSSKLTAQPAKASSAT